MREMEPSLESVNLLTKKLPERKNYEDVSSLLAFPGGGASRYLQGWVVKRVGESTIQFLVLTI